MLEIGLLEENIFLKGIEERLEGVVSLKTKYAESAYIEENGRRIILCGKDGANVAVVKVKVQASSKFMKKESLVFINNGNKEINITVLSIVNSFKEKPSSGFFSFFSRKNRDFKTFSSSLNKKDEKSYSSDSMTKETFTTTASLETENSICGIYEGEDFAKCVLLQSNSFKNELITTIYSPEYGNNQCTLTRSSEIIIKPGESKEVTVEFSLLPRKHCVLKRFINYNESYKNIFSFNFVLVFLFAFVDKINYLIGNNCFSMILSLSILRIFKIFISIFIAYVIAIIVRKRRAEREDLIGISGKNLFIKFLHYTVTISSFITIIFSFKLAYGYCLNYQPFLWIQDLAGPDNSVIFQAGNFRISFFNLFFIFFYLVGNMYEDYSNTKKFNIPILVGNLVTLTCLCFVLNKVNISSCVFLNIILSRIFSFLQECMNGLFIDRIKLFFQ